MTPLPTRGLTAAPFAFLLLLPAGASGQLLHRDFGVQCTTSSFRACASVSAWNEIDPVTGDYNLFVRVANVQGTAGFEGLIAAGLGMWGLDNLNLHNYPVGGVPGGLYESVNNYAPYNARASANGVYECEPNGVDCEEILPGGPAAGAQNLVFDNLTSVRVMSNLYDNPGLLFGCQAVQEAPGWQAWAVYYSTCDGHVTYRLAMYGGAGLELTPQTTVGLSFWTEDIAGNERYADCGPGWGTQNNGACSMVTPEPITMVLLGSGLAAVGGAMRRKRRDEEPDDA